MDVLAFCHVGELTCLLTMWYATTFKIWSWVVCSRISWPLAHSLARCTATEPDEIPGTLNGAWHS